MSVLRNLFWRHPRLHGYLRRALMPLGAEFYLPHDDRRVLEQVILPWFASQPSFKRVLFVGCDWYTRGYRRFFPASTYWTLDVDPAKKRFGSPQHIVAGAESVAGHFAPQSLDLVICNGVYGWGLDQLEPFDAMVEGCRRALRPGGVFVLGWDDNPRRRPFPLQASASLAAMKRFQLPPLATDHYLTANEGRHTFDFFEAGR